MLYIKGTSEHSNRLKKPYNIQLSHKPTNYVSQFTVEMYCFADGRCLFKQPQSVMYHWNQYDEES